MLTLTTSLSFALGLATNMKKPTKAEVIKEALFAQGWAEDRYGHLHLTGLIGSEYRVKFQAISVRLERRIGKDWVRIDSAYLKDVTIVEGAVIIGRKMLGRAVK